LIQRLGKLLLPTSLILCASIAAAESAWAETSAAAIAEQRGLTLPVRPMGMAEAAFSRGVELAEAGRFDEAARLLRLAVELSPDVALYHEVLGDAYVALGDADAYLLAKAEYRAALQLEPDRRRAREGLAQLALTTGRLGEALDALESLAFEPGPDLRYLADLVSLYIAADQVDRGIEALGPHTASPTTPAELLLHLATLHRSRGGFDEALALAERVRNDPGASDEARAMARELRAQWSEERRRGGDAP
jgi:tetratricopeptide (TPR) repeat protein